MSDEAVARDGLVAADERKSPTIYDIARHTGVAPSTVSRALSKPGRINAATERRIRAAADELGYRLNPMARALLTGRTGALGLLVSDITNPVYFGLVRGAESAARESGYTLLLAESQESGDIEGETAEKMLPSIDGLLLVGTRLADEQITALARRKPMVLANRRVAGVRSVVPDVRPGIAAAVAHLAEQCHRSLAYLAGPQASWMSGLRWDAMFSEARAHGISIFDIGPGTPTLDGGREQLERVLASGATAILAYNDLMAIGLLMACQERGVAVPDELSIVGFDDIFGSDFTNPPVTTVRSPLDEVGAAAARRLLSEVGPGNVDTEEILTTRFVLRGSTGPAPGR